MIDELVHSLRRDGDRPAILATGRTGRTLVRATRGELASLAHGYAAGLHQRGLGAGDTIGLAVRPGARSLALMLAARRLGLRIAVLDPTVGPDVLLARLALARPALVLADAAAQAVAGWLRPLGRRFQLALPPLAALGPVATVGSRLPGCAPALVPATGPVPPRREEGGDAVVVFTSGTTSRPRAVVHTWASLSAGMRTVAELVQPRAGTVVLGGTSFVLVPALTAGAAVALPAGSTRALARQLARLRPAETYLTPPRLRDALAADARFTGRVWTGSAPVSAELLGRVKRHGATTAWGVYALTELFPVAVVEEAEKAGYTGAGDLVGTLVPGVSARVDEAGQLLLSGPAARDRYLGEAPTPWVPTGDVARLARDGRVVFAGRAKDMILRRAENIYPGLYEPALHVPGVDLAVLVGVPAGDGDERLVAMVQPEPGADPARIRSALREPLRRMGSARPDAVLFGSVPLHGRSRKPDRAATARLAARLVRGGADRTAVAGSP
jgi:acyl-CoA synthetase (AMP-forming)/AMP-acid ligase II